MELAQYLSSFDYEERKRMKIGLNELFELLIKDQVQFIDIRFKEEYQAWQFPFAKNIPLNELPDRLSELDKNKLVVTACPHYDRAIMARIFLVTQGFKARYLVDGLLGMANFLRGDNARDLLQLIEKSDNL
ncbi:MAG: rhodanese-like domain-containing protein [Caldisericaceae bacterium]|nr:rhodanese-like domain-containing protein [Caldisericaceae bacterium]